jgi:hypothetical protein
MAYGRDLPHDLAQFVVEATLGLQHGSWGLLANGATFKSVVGRCPTKPGQRLIRAHREALNATEPLVNAHVAAWRTGASTPAGPALDAMLVRWHALPVGEDLCVDWPTQWLPRITKGVPRCRLASRQRATVNRDCTTRPRLCV